MSDPTVTTAAVENKKPTVQPLIGDDGKQVSLVVGSASIPMLEKTTPEHKRKKAGKEEIVQTRVDYVPDFTQVGALLLAAQLALSGATAEDKPVLAERIFGKWVEDSVERGFVPNPAAPGTTLWDEAVAAKNLTLARAARKSGTSIEDLRNERSEINNALVPVLEIILVNKDDESQINWDEVYKLTGARITELEALVEWRMAQKDRLRNLEQAIRAKEEAMAKAKENRKAKKANKKSSAEQAIDAAAAPAPAA